MNEYESCRHVNDLRVRVLCIAVMAIVVRGPLAIAADDSPPKVEFGRGDGRLTVVVDGLPVALYSYKDKKITRPYFAHVRAPNGVQVTRHHPPIEGSDPTDHDTFHPGIWMSFGDISGSDFWRNAAHVRQVEFVEEPHGGAGQGGFAVQNEYLDQKDPKKVVCKELARYKFVALPDGYLLLWDSTFESDHDFTFGDQEEMGLGFRMATPLRVGQKPGEMLPVGNGRILDSTGRENEKQIWGNSADWCDFSGTIAGDGAGIAIFCHPENARPSWFHAREYGMLTANMFGRKAFGKGELSAITIKPGEQFRIRYGLLVHSGQKVDRSELESAYRDYVRLAGPTPEVGAPGSSSGR